MLCESMSEASSLDIIALVCAKLNRDGYPAALTHIMAVQYDTACAVMQ